MQSDLPFISENRTAAIGCPVFNDISVFVCNYVIYNITAVIISFLLTSGCCILFTAHCTLSIGYPASKKISMAFRQSTAPIRNLSKIHPPPKEIPRRRPPGISHLQYRMPNWGPVPGRSGRGKPPRDRPLRKASPGGAGRANPQQIFRQASKPLMAIVTPIAETACDAWRKRCKKLPGL